MQTIVIGSDHAGYTLKGQLKEYLEHKGYAVHDVGTHSADSCDYPDFGHALASFVETHAESIGISVCGSGNGINMTANKHHTIRAGLCWMPEIARLARSHNNANICSIPARFVNDETARNIVDEFLNTPFEGGRHQIRIDKIPLP